MTENRPLAEGQVAYLYCLLLSREGDGGGLQDWTGKRRNGMTIAALLQAMASSPEFETRYRVAFLSDERFIALAYRLLLGRDPDGKGRSDYSVALKEGKLTRPDLIGAIAGSDEFRERHKLLFQQS
jgi:hypothetical protein